MLNRGQNRLDDGNMSGALRDLLKAKEHSHTARMHILTWVSYILNKV